MNKKFSVLINSKIKRFNKKIEVESDKSISHRALLIASQCIGPSTLKNILKSEDVSNTVICLKNLGVKILKKKTHTLFMEMVWDLLKNPKTRSFILVTLAP